MKSTPNLLAAIALTLPLAGASAVTFTTDTYISAGNTTYDGQDIAVQGCTLTVNGPHVFHSMSLVMGTTGAVLTHSLAPNGETNNRIQLGITGDFLVDGGCRVDVSGCGYLAEGTPGAAPATADDGGGGGHGGDGGYAYFGPAVEPGGQGGFGSVISPVSFGGSAAGTQDQGYVRCPGGGAVKLVVGGTLTINGQILANGTSAWLNDQGGGAGGSVWIDAGVLAGNGPICANGGSGESSHGGGGAGGRIALYYGTSTHAGTVSGRGGSGKQWGGAGTIFRKLASEFLGNVVIENGNWGAFTPLPPIAAGLCVSNMAQVCPSAPLSLTSLRVATNGVLFHYATQALNLTVSGTVQIDLGGSIAADACGYPIGTNAGPGAAPHTSDDGGGGGYGGDGGHAYWGPSEPGGPGGYGSMIAPTDLGSAGAGSTDNGLNRTAGGGAIRLIVGGTLTVNGRLSANGQAAYQNDQGGASGGSIWVTAGSIAGSGAISANGGNGESTDGGGGGGGRIALYYTNNLFAGSLTAIGAVGRQYGGAGTIFLKSASDTTGTVLVQNGGVDGALTPLAPLDIYHVQIATGARAWAMQCLSVASLTVGSGGHLVPFPGECTIAVESRGDISILSGGEISAAGRGYPFGTNSGPGGGVSGSCAGGGAHGGHGGVGYYGEPGGAGGYGSVYWPQSYGSAGGNGNGGLGGAGGGAIKLIASGGLIVDGVISADGNSTTANNAGGGAGGSIWGEAVAMSGTGTITASGGNGEDGDGGGGGGGRIAGYFMHDLFTGTIRAAGGSGRQLGGAGTIYRRLIGDSSGVLICNNNGSSGAMTPLPTLDYCDLNIAGGAIAYPQFGQTLNLVGLDIKGAGQLTHLRGQTLGVVVLADALVDTNSLICADAAGYPVGSDAGPGAGSFGSDTGSGAGHGGAGGHGYEGNAGGAAYDSLAAPVYWGSAGGPGESGQRTSGGGAIHMDVRGTLTVHGSITANGQNGFTTDQGGASGGSIWLNVNSLAGTGYITTSGGTAYSGWGGGGAGGRVAVYRDSQSLDVSHISASGASGHEWGGNGTVYFGNITNDLPPAVLASTPDGMITTWMDHVDLTFNVAVDSGTFTPLDVVFTTPSGPLAVTDITVTELTPQVFRIGFPKQTMDGHYTLQVGPNISNPFGTPMTAPNSRILFMNFPHSVTFTNSPEGNIVSWPSTAGTFYRLQSSLDLVTWMDLDDWIAGTGLPLQKTCPTIYAPVQFYRILIAD